MQQFRFWGQHDPRGRRKAPLVASVPPSADGGDGVTVLRLYEPIDSWGGDWGTSAREFITALDGIDSPNIRLHINSPGGEVYEAIAVRNALGAHRGRGTAGGDGLAASAASFIAAGAEELAMSPNTELMIHDPWGLGIGNAADFRDLASRLDHIGDNIASIYAAKAGGSVTDWRDAMLAETWYSADEAVSAGLADLVLDAPVASEGPSNRWDLSMYRNRGRGDAPAPVLPSPAERDRLSGDEAARAAWRHRHNAARLRAS